MENSKIDFPYKLCIPYKTLPRGGMYTFFGHVKKYLDRNGISYTENLFSFYDCLIINSFMTPFYKVKLRKILSPGLKIVHRIDGAAEDYGRGAEWDAIQKKVNKEVDLTIFQSQYGRSATYERFKAIDQDGPIIYNPVDTNLFSPGINQKGSKGKPKIAYVTFSTNAKKGLTEFITLAQQNTDLDFVMIGNCPEELKKDGGNIEYTGRLSQKDLAAKLSECHYFLFFSQNETCPNVVLEALSSGLVVLYLDSGGTAELVGKAGKSVTVETFRSQYELVESNWNELSVLSRKKCIDEFNLDYIIEKYLEVIKEMMERKV
jgi:glycosyltransferase involved in cell wall biosynthesis